MLDFLVIKVAFVYNMILGRHCIKMAKVVISTYHLVMKFLIKVGIEKVKVNQLMARETIILQL